MSSDELPINEWIVIFYPQTGVVRLCPTLDFVENTIGRNAVHSAYKSAVDFQRRHDHTSLEKFWGLVLKHARWAKPKTATGSWETYDDTPPDLDTETFARELWQLMQDVGDRLSAPRIVTDKPKEHYELRLNEMRKLITDEEAFLDKYNKQARTVFEALYHYGSQFLVEDEIKKLIYDLVAKRALKTKQKPWVIFQYYRPEFIRDGYIIRGRQPKTTRVRQGHE